MDTINIVRSGNKMVVVVVEGVGVHTYLHNTFDIN
jgi:hypothetical protein